MLPKGYDERKLGGESRVSFKDMDSGYRLLERVESPASRCDRQRKLVGGAASRLERARNGSP